MYTPFLQRNKFRFHEIGNDSQYWKSQLYISFLYHLIVGKCSVSGRLALIVLHFFVIELENCLESFLAGGDKKTAVGVSIFQYLNDSKERCFLACLQVLFVDGFK